MVQASAVKTEKDELKILEQIRRSKFTMQQLAQGNLATCFLEYSSIGSGAGSNQGAGPRKQGSKKVSYNF